MDATAFSLLNLSYPKLTKPTSFLPGENLCRPPPVASYKIQSFQSSNSAIKAWGTTRDSPSSRRTVSGSAFQEDDNRIYKSSDIKSRDRLIALFKRIQTEISERDSRSRNQKHSQASDDDDSSVETSVLDFLQKSNRETKVKRSNKRNEESTRKKRSPKKEKPPSITQPPSEFKPTRLPSNFMKKSPITSPTPLRSNDVELTNTKVPSSEANRELSQIEAMKLSELKELAKERGIRGYSKLKKNELAELLRSQVNA